jgi:hypothetical protein
MPNPEEVYQSPALTQGWEGLKERNLYWFDTENDYPRKHHLDRKNAPIGWDEAPYSVEEAWECIGDDTCTAILASGKEKVLVVVKQDLPAVLIQGKDQKEVKWEDYAREGVMAIKGLYPNYSLEAVVINPKIKTLEDLGVLKSIIKRVTEGKDWLKGGENEPARKKARNDQGSSSGEGPGPGGLPSDPDPGE